MSESLITALIVDDEPLARSMLRRLIGEHSDITLAGECEDGSQAVAFLEARTVDVVFLDVQMPEVDGFGVLAALRDPLPLVVFVTAYDQYALRAFEVHALDYLLKPLDPERFLSTLEHVRRQLRAPAESQRRLRGFISQRDAQPSDRLLIREESRIFFLRTSEVQWIEAEGNYVAIHYGKRRHLLREPISSIETRLDPRNFFRISRSVIVNIDAIQEMQSWFRGEYKVLLKDGTTLKLSHRYRDSLLGRFGA